MNNRAPSEPCQLTASAAAELIRDGRLCCEELVRSCLRRIEARDGQVKAWLHVDAELAIRNARDLDKSPLRGVLHGLPIGVKDIIDTADFPTTQNSRIYEGLRVGRDAACVAVARASGALILGKTDTVEFAAGGRRALTRNPHNLGHTPGGSSSGSGAAVADFMVPMAFGTQTGGSLIRPAAFNGIYGMKPTWNQVSREGARMSSPTLDTIGWYGRCVADLALMAQAFRIPACQEAISVKGLRVGICHGPAWPDIEPAGAAAMEEAAQRLSAAGALVHELQLPDQFNGLIKVHKTISDREGGASFLPEYLNAPQLLAEVFRAKVENARNVSDEELLRSYAIADACRPQFDALFGSSLDVIVTPSAAGEAPAGRQDVGKTTFHGFLTLLHVPCIAIPAGRGPAGLPVGVQLTGPRMSDGRLLAIAGALAPIIEDDPGANLRALW